MPTRSLFGRTLFCASLIVAASCHDHPVPRATDVARLAHGQHPHRAANLHADAQTKEAQAAPSPSVSREGPSVSALPVPGYLPAVVHAPADDGMPHPALLITHGAGGRPEAHCERYREIIKVPVFLLCTRGRALDRLLPPEERGYFYDGHHELGKEALAAMEALAARFGDRVDGEKLVFVGYSQGASMGALFLQLANHATHFSRALLVEGGAADWNVALSHKLASSGLSRVAIVCGQSSCKHSADRSIGWMKRGGLESRLWYAPGAGHTYAGAVAPLVEEAFAWLVVDDPRFSEPVALP